MPSKRTPEALVYGFHAVEAILARDASAVSELWFQVSRRDERISRLTALAEAAGTSVHPRDRRDLDRMVNGVGHQGVVARARATPAVTWPELAVMLEGLDESCLLLVMDGVQDPHNLGACLRAAGAAGVHAVVAPKDRSVPLNATVRRVACGAAERVPFVQVTNLSRTLSALCDLGVQVVGAAADADLSLYDADLRGRLALVVGSEGRGLRRLTRERCDRIVRIPMSGPAASLNVAVATGVLLFEATRQRRSLLE